MKGLAMPRKKSQHIARPAPSPGSFISNYLHWDDPRLGDTEALDTTMGTTRGGNAATGLDFTEANLRKSLEKGTLNEEGRKKAEKGLRDVEKLRGVVKDKPTTVKHISKQFSKMFIAGVQRGVDENTQIPGAEWYFEQRVKQRQAMAPEANLSVRQTASMAAKLSSGKSPEDEIVSLSGISHLVSTHREHLVNNVPVHQIESKELGRLASAASAWNAYQIGSSKKRPKVPLPEFSSEEVRTHMVNAGRAHQHNVGVATAVARGEMKPEEAFIEEKTPKTAAYGETQAQAEPNSIIHGDVRNVATHIRDVFAGRVSRDQGMMLFSQEEGQPRHHMLSSRTPMPQDTWQVAIGSGQEMLARSKSKSSKGIGRLFSPAKRLVEKGFPLDPTAYGKKRLGLEGTPKEVTPEAAVSAQHNEALRHASEHSLGRMSHDQFGKIIYTPSALIQPVEWTEGRKQANADEEFNTAQKEKAKQAAMLSKMAPATPQDDQLSFPGF